MYKQKNKNMSHGTINPKREGGKRNVTGIKIKSRGGKARGRKEMIKRSQEKELMRWGGMT